MSLFPFFCPYWYYCICSLMSHKLQHEHIQAFNCTIRVLYECFFHFNEFLHNLWLICLIYLLMQHILATLQIFWFICHRASLFYWLSTLVHIYAECRAYGLVLVTIISTHKTIFTSMTPMSISLNEILVRWVINEIHEWVMVVFVLCIWVSGIRFCHHLYVCF